MATLKEVKNRIRSVISTKRITKAMEMVAAANLRRAQQRVEQARPYSKMMEQMLSHLAGRFIGRNCTSVFRRARNQEENPGGDYL